MKIMVNQFFEHLDGYRKNDTPLYSNYRDNAPPDPNAKLQSNNF